jgi:hypothetical protein
MNIEVKISFDKTAAGLIQELINAIAGLAIAINKLTATGSAATRSQIQPASTVKKDEPVSQEEASVSKEEQPITIEQVREAFLVKNSSANKPKLKAILEQFGVKKVTDLKEKDFPAVLEALEKI